jgi:TonB-dependent receptor
MGRFPDASAPEAVQRIPGISVQRDMGEGRYIQIRGGSPQMTSVTFNGERVPSPEGDERQIALDAVPVDILESIEVSKAITPDMDVDAIGGSVNLVTKKAPEGRTFTVELGGGYAPIREDYSPSGSITYGNRIANNKFGYLFSVSSSRRNFGADDLEPVYELNDPGLSDDELEELEVRHYTLWRQRTGATAMLDYEFNTNSRLYVNGIFAEMQDDEQRRRLIHVPVDDEMAFEHKSRHENLRSMNLTAGGEHLTSSGIGIDYHLTVTRSEEDTPNDNEIAFEQGDIAFNPNISDPDNIRSNPVGNPFANDFEFDKIEPASSLTRDDDIVGGANMSLPYRLGATVGKLELGFKYRDKEKTQDVFEEEYELVDGADDIILGNGIGEPFDMADYVPGNYPFPPRVTHRDEVDDFVDNYRSVLTGEKVIEDDVEDFQVDEQTLAGYIMSEININPLFMVLPGVRVEKTTVDAVGYVYDPDEETITQSTGETDYTKFFPMVHARYRLTPTTNLRAAFTTALARPNFFDMAPYRLRDDEDLELGNPNLDPATSVNYDVMLEHYDRTIGIISLGAFHKAITDPIFIFAYDNELGGTTEQPRNGESGTITGVEFAIQKQLKFLPSPLDGLGIYGNYTYTSSDATLPGGREAQFAGQPENVYNLALSYEKSGFSGQVSLNYHDKFITEFGSDVEDSPDSDIWIDKHLQLDLSASYQITSGINIFLELVNLTNEPLRAFQGYEERPIQMEYYKPWSRLGIRYSL